MAEFQSPIDLIHNRGLIADPVAFAKDAGAASWLYLCGEEFAAMQGGMSYADVRSAVPESVNLNGGPAAARSTWRCRPTRDRCSGPVPRPTLVTCRTGPRSSALVYLHAGLRSGALSTTCLPAQKPTAFPSLKPSL